VGSLPGLVPAIRAELFAQLGGYPGLPEHAEDSFVVPAALGGMAGPAGTLILAEQAAMPHALLARRR
jgi:fructokinase